MLKTKKMICIGMSLAISSLLLASCGTTSQRQSSEAVDTAATVVDTDENVYADAAEVVEDIATTQYFTDEAVPEDVTESILTAGINSPSAMNGQSWHFTAVTDKSVLDEIAEDMSAGMPARVNTGTSSQLAKAGIADAPLAIIISCADGSDFDAGLACQSMSVEANLLGYGTKIISSPKMALNGEKKAEYDAMLEIPEGYSAVAVLLVGKENTEVDTSADGYTGATERNAYDETVTYVE